MTISFREPATCSGCGFQTTACVCGRKRNTSGSTVQYNNYTDLRDTADYATTARINRSDGVTRKTLDEMSPMENENLQTYIERTSIAETKLVEWSIHHHIYGTKSTWACHKTSRECFICLLCQQVELNRMVLEQIPNPAKYTISITDGKIQLHTAETRASPDT